MLDEVVVEKAVVDAAADQAAEVVVLDAASDQALVVVEEAAPLTEVVLDETAPASSLVPIEVVEELAVVDEPELARDVVELAPALMLEEDEEARVELEKGCWQAELPDRFFLTNRFPFIDDDTPLIPSRASIAAVPSRRSLLKSGVRWAAACRLAPWFETSLAAEMAGTAARRGRMRVEMCMAEGLCRV